MKDKESELKIDKIDAAKRQLKHAIENFFRDGDVVVTHNLASASLQILHDLGEKEGISSIFGFEWVKKARRKEVKDSFREAQNFFKHADREGDEKNILKFKPDITNFFILDACLLYKNLNNDNLSHIVLFECWFRKRYPHVCKWDNEEYNILFKKQFGDIHYCQKNEFLKLLTELEYFIKIKKKFLDIK